VPGCKPREGRIDVGLQKQDDEILPVAVDSKSRILVLDPAKNVIRIFDKKEVE